MPVSVPQPVPPLPSDYVPPSPLTEEHEIKRVEVLKHFSASEYKLPRAEKNGELMEEERFWLTNDCLLRYLRASKWDAETAITRLESTLLWRREYGLLDVVTADLVEPEGGTGKLVTFGFDKQRRPAWYMFPSRQNTDVPANQIQFTVFGLERVIDLMGPGVETLTLFLNFADKAKSPSFNTSKTVLHILQDHYPERLGDLHVIKVPWIANLMLKAIMPFIDPVTRAKLHFNGDPVADGYIDADSCMNAVGWTGNVDFVYEHEEYWKALIGMCEDKRAREKEVWKELGGTIGLHEFDFKKVAAERAGGHLESRDLKVEESAPVDESTGPEEEAAVDGPTGPVESVSA